jgi:peptide/nickel transport system substrate-binding protein
MKTKHWIWVGLFVVFSLVVSACGPAATPTAEVAPPTEPPAAQATVAKPPTAVATETPPEPVVLRIGMTFEPDTLHPFMTATSWRFLDFIYEGFVGWGLDCEFTPRLAESLETSEDGLTNIIHLRPGITYSDGQPFNAYVLKESWDWFRPLEVSAWFPLIRLLDSYEALDELTFRFTTTVPVATWRTYDAVWTWPFAPHIWGSLDDNTIWGFDNNTNPVGTGPYTLTEWVPGDYMIFDARADYYLGKPPIDRVVIQFYGNWDAEINALLGGEVDITESYIPAQFYGVLEGDPNVTFVERPPAYYYILAFNVYQSGNKHPAIDDPKVREAIDYAINRQQLVDVALIGHGITCPTNWNCGPLFEWSLDPSIAVTPFDLAKASSILDEAGYVDSDGDGVRETAGGEPLDLRLYFPSDRVAASTMAEYVAEWLSEIGIGVSVEAMERGTLESATTVEHDFDMVLRFDASDPDPATVDWWWSCWSAEGGTGNASGYCNPEVDDLIYQQLTALGEENRMAALFEAERIVAQDRPFVMLVAENATQAYRSDRFVFPDNPCSFFGMCWQWAPLLQAEPVE